MSDISFFHIASVYRKATEQVVANARKYHPNSFYHLAVDAVDSYEYLAEEFDLDYRYYTKKIGGPVGDYGYRLENTLEFLNRFYNAAVKCNTSHIVMMEDDVWLLDKITVNPEWEHAGADTKIGNVIPEPVHDLIERHCGKRPLFKQYGAGGGTIFKVSTFVENYDIIVRWFKDNFAEIQAYYPTIGYIDCFMNVYYYLCGKDYSANLHRTDTHNHRPGFDYETFVSNLTPEIQIVNNYKKFYYE